MVIDLGTGDGTAVVRRARREPGTLTIGIEPVAATLAESSRRAARAASKGGLPNALFLAGSAEQLPGPLAMRADEITIALPWGALLDGILDPASGTADRLGATLRASGELTLLLSLTDVDRPDGRVLDVPAIERLAADYAAAAFDCLEHRPASAADVAVLSSAWGRRLGIPEQRPGWLLRLRLSSGRGRPPSPPGAP